RVQKGGLQCRCHLDTLVERHPLCQSQFWQAHQRFSSATSLHSHSLLWYIPPQLDLLLWPAHPSFDPPVSHLENRCQHRQYQSAQSTQFVGTRGGGEEGRGPCACPSVLAAPFRRDKGRW